MKLNTTNSPIICCDVTFICIWPHLIDFFSHLNSLIEGHWICYKFTKKDFDLWYLIFDTFVFFNHFNFQEVKMDLSLCIKFKNIKLQLTTLKCNLNISCSFIRNMLANMSRGHCCIFH